MSKLKERPFVCTNEQPEFYENSTTHFPIMLELDIALYYNYIGIISKGAAV